MIIDKAAALEPQLIEWRRDFHMHPELGFQEFRTAKKVAEILADMGVETQTGVGKTGVVALIGDEGGPVVGIRGDMDALPIQEAHDVSYKSQTDGVMHACGHDAHTSILLGVARIFSEMEERPVGQIRLFFQPSEERQDAEGESGATRMIADGALEGVDAVIALHVDSQREMGKIDITPGYICAATDAFDAAILGKGGHAAYPHRTVDPIYLLGHVLQAIQGNRARRIDPMKEAVITVGSVHAGHTYNVIPDEVTIKGTIRSYDPAVRQLLWQELEAAFSITRALGGDYKLTIHEGYPSLYNDPAVADLIKETAIDLLGDSSLLTSEPGMGGEDFAYMAQQAPGAMFKLGAKYDDMSRPHHNPNFDIDEKAMKVGTALLAESAMRLLKQHA